ncbi:hypothetical protein MES5069_220180 [Mesorhizobium escarrei]|uniref:Uncharacterized protein n=1 Tax=Mesorhizobium escarrei TaxID=666018 RepID=A0ABN8JQV5_9HYPH|nr:hypothetical protein MES5069_220180 [Mesorhizobium escarrei]
MPQLARDDGQLHHELTHNYKRLFLILVFNLMAPQ